MTFQLRKLNTLTRRTAPAVNDILHLRSPATGKDHYVLLGDVLGSSYSDWNSGTTYADGDRVTYGLRLWESLQNGNTGNVPTEEAWWTEVSPTTPEADLLEVATAGGTITLDMANKKSRYFVGDASFGTAKTIAISNAGNALEIPWFRFELSGAAALTLPGGSKMDDIYFSGGDWTPLDAGEYKLRGSLEGGVWWFEIKGPFKT